MLSFDSKVALVTGAARGIGRAIAAGLAAGGASVMLNDLDSEPLTEVSGSLSGASSLAGDLTDPAFPQKLVNETLARFGAIDIVVNNAGYTWDSTIQKTTDEQFQAMLDIHVVAPFRLLRAAAPWLRETAKQEAAQGISRHRKVVNITSIAATDGGAGQAGYASGKGAIIGLTRSLAKEWGRYRVNVNAVGFGLIETRLIQPMGADSSIHVKGREIRVGVQPQALEKVIAASPFGRAGTVEEAAGPVLFLCSPLSDFVTGEVVMCTGGMHF
jgi:3-oxoacyl-[acyl-carrier protein] reductase